MSDEEKQEAREPVKESASPREEKSATAKDDGEVDADDQGNDHGEHRERHKKKKHKEHKEHRDDKDRCFFPLLTCCNAWHPTACKVYVGCEF
eukprot:5688579-Pleurochrysis_carterae.AAC.3